MTKFINDPSGHEQARFSAPSDALCNNSWRLGYFCGRDASAYLVPARLGPDRGDVCRFVTVSFLVTLEDRCIGRSGVTCPSEQCGLTDDVRPSLWYLSAICGPDTGRVKRRGKATLGLFDGCDPDPNLSRCQVFGSSLDPKKEYPRSAFFVLFLENLFENR